MIHYKIKVNVKYVSKSIYTILDINKEILGLYLSESEETNFWLNFLIKKIIKLLCY